MHGIKNNAGNLTMTLLEIPHTGDELTKRATGYSGLTVTSFLKEQLNISS